MDYINRCAYFDYQRDRVYLRTSGAVRSVKRRRHRAKQAGYKVNGEQLLELPESCPACGGMKLSKYDRLAKTVYDLRLMRHGVKKWVVRYNSHRLFCHQCNKVFTPHTFHHTEKFGHIVRAWSVYHTISMRVSQSAIHDGLRDLFGYKGRGDIAAHLKRVAANYYRATHDRLLDAIRNGNLVHVDETKVSIKGVTGYVWAFTNLETVVYVYTNTREGDLLHEMLDGFQGVLVSDFYAAYDSVPCRQQKCLIHLMRDINDDLFKNPFDQELKDIAREFTATLGPIVETIDKYGLKKMHLHKHKAGADRFVRNILGRSLASDIAKGYQKRLRKNQDTLFTFLDFDGIPWNNNNAEHAIKRFAFLRHVIGGSSSERGIKDYLILLSICETLRLRGVSFLKFLISQALDIDEYVRNYR